MIEALARHGVSCDRCYERPHLRDCLGCGKPPTRDNDPMMALWRLVDGEVISPAAASRRGLPAYADLGVGDVRQDWPWCPRWFSVFSQATVASVPTMSYMASIHPFIECNELASAVPPPWTAAFVDLVAYWKTVRSAYNRAEIERHRRENRRK